jgi:hypothetical protein
MVTSSLWLPQKENIASGNWDVSRFYQEQQGWILGFTLGFTWPAVVGLVVVKNPSKAPPKRGLKTIHKCFAASRRGWLIICTCGGLHKWGIPSSWMVCKGKSQSKRNNGWFGGTPIYGTPHVVSKYHITESRVSSRVVDVSVNHPAEATCWRMPGWLMRKVTFVEIFSKMQIFIPDWWCNEVNQ